MRGLWIVFSVCLLVAVPSHAEIFAYGTMEQSGATTDPLETAIKKYKIEGMTELLSRSWVRYGFAYLGKIPIFPKRYRYKNYVIAFSGDEIPNALKRQFRPLNSLRVEVALSRTEYFTRGFSWEGERHEGNLVWGPEKLSNALKMLKRFQEGEVWPTVQRWLTEEYAHVSAERSLRGENAFQVHLSLRVYAGGSAVREPTLLLSLFQGTGKQSLASDSESEFTPSEGAQCVEQLVE